MRSAYCWEGSQLVTPTPISRYCLCVTRRVGGECPLKGLLSNNDKEDEEDNMNTRMVNDWNPMVGDDDTDSK